MEPRDFKDPRYVKWRKAVYSRDKFACKMPGCAGLSKQLNAHHIRTWTAAPELRFVVGNGITLCKVCHDRVWQCESEFESLFMSLVGNKVNDFAILMAMMRYGQASP